jgi:hypothetical protein
MPSSFVTRIRTHTPYQPATTFDTSDRALTGGDEQRLPQDHERHRLNWQRAWRLAEDALLAPPTTR